MNLQSIKQRYGIIGRSPGLDRALSTAVRVAPINDISVLITGESGVGKEVFSRIIHQQSPRKHEKFIAINCGAIPAGTINSELFGHEKGAFTGATTERKGYFETYNKGTIFLDEIGEMPLETQAFLLRILESGEYIRVGSSKVLTTDVRVLAATNVNLEANIKKGKFREDLYFRLNTVPIVVPPLRERREDIYPLFRKFAVDFAEKYRTSAVRIDDRAQILLENYGWPGNIRQLKNIAEQVSILSEEKEIGAEELLDIMPDLLNRNLPSISNQKNGRGGNNMEEREIMFQLLFDMKKDLNDLKRLVVELVNTNNLRMPDVANLPQLMAPSQMPETFTQRPKVQNNFDNYLYDNEETTTGNSTDLDRPILLNNTPSASGYDRSVEVEENLSLADNEKELIQKALKKHKNRRKDAASELGISERTLYRKIKEYDL
ncbi:MAG: sigma-54 dependent transcriptional regulator [Bacteroidota bacterium]